MDFPLTLDSLPADSPAMIAHIAWDAMPEDDAKRLRALGIDTGSELTVLHRGVLGARDPLAIRLGRMTVALRRAHAAAIAVERCESAHP